MSGSHNLQGCASHSWLIQHHNCPFVLSKPPAILKVLQHVHEIWWALEVEYEGLNPISVLV